MQGDKAIVVLTRTENDPHGLDQKFPNIHWIDFPLIKFEYQKIPQEELDLLNGQFDWFIFTSQNGVKSFMQNKVDLSGKKIACVGSKTASLVEKSGYKVDFIPSTYTSFELAKHLPSHKNESICYVGGNLSSQSTIKILQEKTHRFLQVESYQTVYQKHSKEAWRALFSVDLDVISFCSPSAVQSYVDQTNAYQLPASKKVRFAAIGSTTAQSITDLLHQTPIVPVKHTFATMIEEIVSIL